MKGRQALVAAAVSLFQARGYHGVGVADILARAGLPRGSLYHHFAGGKEALAVAAVHFIGDEVEALLEHRLQQWADAGAVYAQICTATADWLEQSGFKQGALIGALAAGPDAPALARAVAHTHERWAQRFAAALAKDGDAERPMDRARTMLAALEGAVLMARAAQDASVLRGLVRTLQSA